MSKSHSALKILWDYFWFFLNDINDICWILISLYRNIDHNVGLEWILEIYNARIFFVQRAHQDQLLKRGGRVPGSEKQVFPVSDILCFENYFAGILEIYFWWGVTDDDRQIATSWELKSLIENVEIIRFGNLWFLARKNFARVIAGQTPRDQWQIPWARQTHSRVKDNLFQMVGTRNLGNLQKTIPAFIFHGKNGQTFAATGTALFNGFSSKIVFWTDFPSSDFISESFTGGWSSEFIFYS